MKRGKLAILLLPAGLALVLVAALAWLQYTQAGARWIWSQAGAFIPGTLQARDIRGDLRSGLTLQDVTFENKNTSVIAGTLRLQAGFDLFPPALTVASLEASHVTVKKLPQVQAGPAASFGDTLARLSLPVPLIFTRVRIDQLVYQAENGLTTFESKALSLSGQWFESWRVREMNFRTPAVQWTVHGEIGFTFPFPVEASVESRVDVAGGRSSAPPALRILGYFSGNLTDLKTRVELERPAVTVQGHIHDLSESPNWDLNLLSDELRWPLDSDVPQVSLKKISAHSSGSLHQYELSGTGELGLQGLPVMSANLSGQGDTGRITIENLNLTGEKIQLTAQGPLSWMNGFRIELSSEIKRLDPGLWFAAWPQDHPLNGNLALDWEQQRIAVSRFRLNAKDNDFSVQGSGKLDLAANIVDADLEWKSLRWPLASRQADFSSEHGSAKVHGKLDDWSVAGTLQLQAGQWPDGVLRLSGQGNRESVQLLIERGEVLGGAFDGQFNYRWADKKSWSAKVNAKNLDITPLSRAFPGVISGTLSAQGTIDPMEFDIETDQLSGVIRGQRMLAHGGISFKDDGMRARNLYIQSGRSNLTLDGSLRSADGVRFSADITSLADLIKNAGGSLKGSGRFSANAEHPRLELNLQGHDLAWGQWRLGALSASQRQDLEVPATTTFELTDLSFGNQLMDTVTMVVSGEKPFDDIQLTAKRGATHLQASLAGGISDWGDLTATHWSGKVRSMRIDNATLGFLQLEQAAELAFDSSSLNVGPACLKGSRNGRACVDTSWSNGKELTAHAKLEAISLNLMQLFLGTNLDYSQTLTGELRWQQTTGSKPTAEARIEMSPGQIDYANEETVLSTGPGLLQFSINNGQLVSGNLNLALPGAGSIHTDFKSPDVSQGIDSAIEGRIQIGLNHIEPLLKWIPTLVDRFAGTVNADVRVSGTLADPRLTGHASLVRGRFEHIASGTVISDIQLAGAVYNFDYTEFNGSFKSGQGQGRIKAAVKFDNIFDPDITMTLTGQDLSLIDVHDIRVKADPDLRLRWHDNLLNMDGRILIPAARISPRNLPLSSAAESPDLVIIGGEQAPPEQTYFDRSRLRLNGNIEVELGDDVTIKLERATARLRGKVNFIWDHNLLPMADGVYTLSGKISAYGQLLEVADGRVSFPRVPADNPNLNINAQREIYGNLQIKQAGVHVTGTLKHPELEPYTTPNTTRERALTLLVTGHDFDYSKGVGGVEVGMYVAPRLYVSYGLGLFESQSVISARYDLKNGFGIKATSGQRETGADISYTVEH